MLKNNAVLSKTWNG